MPTNRSSMPGKARNRKNALFAYQVFDNIVVPSGGQIGGLSARFSSFANTVQTRLNSSNGTTGGLGGTLEAQVNSALSQVLRQPGNGTSTALATRPSDNSIGSLVGGGGGLQPAMSPYQAALLREARIVEADLLSVLGDLQPLSAFTDPGDIGALQAVLRAEVSGLLEEFSYTRLLPRQQRVRVFLGGLLGWNYDSFGVASPLAAGAPPGDIQAMVNLLNLGGPLVPTISVEDQLSNQQVLGSDGALFDNQWGTFWNTALRNLSPTLQSPTWQLWETGLPAFTPLNDPGGLGALFLQIETPGSLISLGPRSSQLSQQAPWRLAAINQSGALPGASYAYRMIQADLLLPVIAQDASRVEDDLTAIGFSTGDQETQFASFWSAVDADLLPAWGSAPAALPVPPSWPVVGATAPTGVSAPLNLTPIPVVMTVADILDWARNLAGPTSADQLRQAGALGLNLVCDQADELFWLVTAMLDPTATAQISALSDPEVQLELYSLATDLKMLADLAY